MLQSLNSPVARAAMLAAVTLIAPPLRADIVDRVAAIVGSEAITLSQVRTELNMAALLNRAEPASLEAGGAEALRRLIDRRLIMQDLASTPFLQAPTEEIEGQIEALRAATFADGRDLPVALRHHGLSEDDCRRFLREQASFERYVSFRFKTGQDVSAEAVEAHYRDVYSPRQAALGATVQELEAVRQRITDELAERQANRLLEQRIMELRALSRIEVLAFDAAGAER